VTDQTLVIACHPFDAVHNPRLTFQDAKWVAVIINDHYEPFLRKRFPEGRWFSLSEGIPYTAGGGILGIIPVLPQNNKVIRRFVEADQSLRSAVYLTINHMWKEPQSDIVQALFEKYPLFQNDPFLEACFWEKIFFHFNIDHTDQQSLNAMNQALKHGYSAAHLYYNLGIYLTRFGFRKEALASFKAAMRSPVNYTSAQQKIDLLKLVGTKSVNVY